MRRVLLSSCLFFTMVGTSAQAQRGEGPVVVGVETEREVAVTAAADGLFDQDNTIDTADYGLFAASVTADQTGGSGSTAGADASQDTLVTNSEISGTLFASGEAHRAGGGTAKSTSAAEVYVEFTVPVDTEFTLMGSFVASDDLAGACGASASAGIAGINAEGAAFLFSAGYCDEDPPGDSSFTYHGTLGAGETITLGVSADIYLEENDFIDLSGAGSAVADFLFFFGEPPFFADGFETGDLSGWSTP